MQQSTTAGHITNGVSYTANPEIVRTYRADWVGRIERKKVEGKLFANGYKIIREEHVKERNFNCCLALIFLPLAFVKQPMVKVTYVWETQPTPANAGN